MTAPLLTPLDRTNGRGRASDRVFDELASAIRDLRLPPGCALSETDLAEQLHVSRTPVREAISRLVDAGLVQVMPQVGTKVARIRMTDVHVARFVRETLESAVFVEACRQPVRNLTGLHESLARQEEAHATGDLDAFFAADEALHIEIFALSGYGGAWQVVQRTKLQLDRLRRLSLPEPSTLRTLIDDHRAIVNALAERMPIEGQEFVRTHARRVLDHLPTLEHRHPDYFGI